MSLCEPMGEFHEKARENARVMVVAGFLALLALQGDPEFCDLCRTTAPPITTTMTTTMASIATTIASTRAKARARATATTTTTTRASTARKEAEPPFWLEKTQNWKSV